MYGRQNFPLSIDRVSKFHQEVQEILENIDKEASVAKDSGKHKNVNWATGVIELSDRSFKKKENLSRYSWQST